MTTMVDSKENVRVGQDKVSEKIDRKNKQVQTQRYMAAVKSEKDKKIRVCGPVWCVCVDLCLHRAGEERRSRL